MFTCGDHGALVSYVYGECEPRERLLMSAHIAVCSACAEELAGLGATREQLALWSPPDAKLGFRIVGDAPAASNVLRPMKWWRQPMPAWAQAAAAVLIFATGATLGVLRNATVRGSEATAPVASSASLTAGASKTPVTQADLAALEQRLRGEISGVRATSAPLAAGGVRTAAATGPADAQMLARVQQMIDESEQRQQHELTLRTAEVVRDVDAQRNDDLARIERTMGQMDGTTGVEVAQQRQVLNYLMRVSQRGQ
jgi:anti-sigma factor RsiW